MFLTEFKSISVPAGLEYFWVRNNISLYCGALSRVFVWRIFFVEIFSTFPLPPGFSSGFSPHFHFLLAFLQESHECGAAGCYIEAETADQFE